tara:strand:+ start:2949 stop:3371 length:423 start_codon:yes stop_codon:yes gene_type:complete
MSSDISNKFKDAIKLSEGYRARVYKDTLDIDTIGYGFTIKDLALEEDICDIILERKLEVLVKRVNDRFEFIEDLPEEAREVVYEMAYQMGVSGVSKFKRFLQALKEGDYGLAAIEMLDSRWSKQTPNRAKRLSDIIKGLE